jgi:hypothetical protein
VALASTPTRSTNDRSAGRHLDPLDATKNPTWGAPRIHGELHMIGFDVTERTISRYMPRRHPIPTPSSAGSFSCATTAMRSPRWNFFTVPTVTFRVLYVWFVVENGQRRILRSDVTKHPAATWVIQQLREAFPFDAAAAT